MKLTTITTIELSSKCNLSCRYCINRLMEDNGRTPGIMLDDVFERSLEWLGELVRRGTQKEVNLNGNGESLLDPKFLERAKRVKQAMGTRTVMLCSNGLLVTDEMARAIKETGIDRMDLSPHSPYHARKAVYYLGKHKIYGVLNVGSILQSHNWAGQLPDEDQYDFGLKILCHPLIEGRGYIDSDGFATPCCYDYLRKGKFGSVFDDDLLDVEYGRFELCDTCHQQIPNESEMVKIRDAMKGRDQ